MSETSISSLESAASLWTRLKSRRRRKSAHPVLLIARRLLAAAPVLLGVSVLTFVVLNVLPGNAAEQLLGPEATPEQVAQLEQQLHLDRPAPERYLQWITGVLKGDLGRSLASNQKVAALVAQRLPVTLELLAYAFVLALGLAVPAALLAARYPNRLVDRLTAIAGMTALSVPSYVLSVLLVLALAVLLPLFPSMGFTPIGEDLFRNVRSLTLPAVSIALPLFGFYSRFLRADLLEQMRREAYVVTAAAKGVGPWRILIRHAFRNSALGLLTMVGLNVGTLVGGTVIVEQIFALPGIGQFLLQSINTRDVIAVQGVVLLLATVSVIANLCVDLLYGMLDPRIGYGER